MPTPIRQRLEVSSYLHKGVKIVFEDEATEGEASSSSTPKAWPIT